MVVRIWRKGNLCAFVDGSANWYGHYGKEYEIFLKKLKIELPYDSAIPPLHFYPKEIKTGFQKRICTFVFIGASFTRAKR